MATTKPLPESGAFDENVERVLRDPAVHARLDAIKTRRQAGTLVTHSNDEVRARLVELGVPLTDETTHHE